MRTGFAYGPPDRLALVAAEVVEAEDVAWGQSRDQDLLDPGAEPVAVDGAVEHEGRVDSVTNAGRR
jgi:hypothetical protein